MPQSTQPSSSSIEITHQLKSPFYLPGGHLQTIVPALLRSIKISPTFTETINTPDGDFLELEWHTTSQKSEKPLVILTHGFEGNSRSSYILSMVKTLQAVGHPCLAWNMRSCGSRPNLKPHAYHSGFTQDLQEVILHAHANGFEQVVIIGFSLGGNLTLKYAAELGQGIYAGVNVQKVVAISVPADLKGSAIKTESGLARVYARRFLKSLELKLKLKQGMFPDNEVLKQALSRGPITTIREYDRYITALLHGYRDDDDYYNHNASMHFLQHIKLPTLAIGAINDPMISESSHAALQHCGNPLVQYQLANSGGHVGFVNRAWQWSPTWAEGQVVEFLV